MRPTARLLALLAVPAAVLLPSHAGATGYDCTKASTPAEIAVCANPALSKLDERVATEYADTLLLMTAPEEEKGPVGRLLKAEHRAWKSERDACGADLGCLRAAYDRRLKALDYGPSPATQSSAARYLGRFVHQDLLSVTAVALRDGRVAVSATGGDLKGRWACNYTGVGLVDDKGKLVVGTPNAEGGGLVIEPNGSHGIRIADTEANRAASVLWCGNGGSFAVSYKRKW